MRGIRTLLRDRRRSQHGGVLSGVLIILAFVAIIAGALMSELSTNLLLSSSLMSRSLNEATVNSATELAVNQMETSPISAGCPSLASVQLNLNGRWALPSFTSCWPSYRERVYPPIATSAAFNVEGSHSALPSANPAQDLYVVGDAAGNVYEFPFGRSGPNWVYQVPGGVTGPPVTVRDFAAGQTAQDLMTLVPFSPGSGAPAACSSGGCVVMLAEDTNASPRGPDVFCYMAASGQVTTPAALGVNYATVALFGDQKGSVFAYAASEKLLPCAQKVTVSGNGQPVIAGPYVFAGPTNGVAPQDAVYVVTSNAVLQYFYTEEPGEAPELEAGVTLPLPWSGAVGVALERGALPTRLVISFSNGHLAVVQLSTNFGMAVVSTAVVPTAIRGAPSWCHCPGPTDQLAVGGSNGVLYLFDAFLNQLASLAAAGPPILTGVATDSIGEWFYGDSSGYIHEIQRLAGQPSMTEVARYGPVGGAINTTLQVAPCSNLICMYFGAQNGSAYRVPLDARSVVITTCISATLPSCSGANPHLWTTMEIGREGFPNEVHVQGWSYYSA